MASFCVPEKLASRKSAGRGDVYGPGRAQSSGPGSRAGPPGTRRSEAVFGVGNPGEAMAVMVQQDHQIVREHEDRYNPSGVHGFLHLRVVLQPTSSDGEPVVVN